MRKDTSWKSFFLDDERFADIINGIGCKGKQIVTKEDLQDVDTQSGFLRRSKFVENIPKKKNVKIRDMVKKVAFGMNFAIIGLENQENMDYSIPVRTMYYDIDSYEKQLTKIRKEIRKNSVQLTGGEYLYGFRKDSKLCPVISFILYSGSRTWDGPLSLHDILDFENIPQELRDMVSNYKINLIDIRQLEDTSVFRTDVRQVFEFIKCANDKRALKTLVEKDEYYKNMDEDAFDVAVQYTNARELIEAKEYYEKDGSVDMCE